MFVSHLGLRSWLARWFGGACDATEPERRSNAAETDASDEQQGPVFSLGDTKQDVLVSFRGHPEKS